MFSNNKKTYNYLFKMVLINIIKWTYLKCINSVGGKYVHLGYI